METFDEIMDKIYIISICNIGAEESLFSNPITKEYPFIMTLEEVLKILQYENIVGNTSVIGRGYLETTEFFPATSQEQRISILKDFFIEALPNIKNKLDEKLKKQLFTFFSINKCLRENIRNLNDDVLNVKDIEQWDKYYYILEFQNSYLSFNERDILESVRNFIRIKRALQ